MRVPQRTSNRPGPAKPPDADSPAKAPAPAPEIERAVPRPWLDLRLVPAALLLWAVTAATLASTAAGYVLLAVALAAAAIAAHKRWPTVAVPSVLAVAGVVGTRVRQWQAQAHELAAHAGERTTTTLTLTTTPRTTEFGATAEATVPGLPGRLRVFGDERLLAHDRGTMLEAVASVAESERPALSGLTASLRGTVRMVAAPDDRVARVREGLRDAASGLWPGPDRLVPAMTLGDERGFTAADQEMMVDSGLAHLSAVSGANVAIVTGAAVWAFSWAPPRWRVVVAAVALASFVAVVGTEPSVLRAMMTGSVGLLAVVAGRRGQAIPALSAGVTLLLLAFPDLSVSAGFMLSVAATAGLVLAAVPVTRRLLVVPWVRRWPAPIVRATAVALVAHVATVPVLALFIGEVSHVAVFANIAATPAVAPVTVLGTAAAVAALLGLGPVVAVLVHLAAPFAWWVYAVGYVAAGVPGAAGEIGIVGVTAMGVGVAVALRWPAIAAAIGVMAATAAVVAVGLGLHVPKAPEGWVLGACAIADGNVTADEGRGEADGDRAPQVRIIRPGEEIPDRRCRLALSREPGAGAGGPASESEGRVQGTLDELADDAAAATGPPSWFVVGDCGERARRSIRTPGGTPVVCPARDGPQALYPDGGVWRGSGTMEP